MFFKSPRYFFSIILLCCSSIAQSQNVQKTSNGIVITLQSDIPNNAKQIKLEVISDKIIHVLAGADDNLIEPITLIRVPVISKSNFSTLQSGDVVSLKTASLIVKVSLKTGSISFTDMNGNVLLKEIPVGGKSFKVTSNDGEASYKLSQTFESSSNEAFYGLGQHQNNLINYKGHQVELLQNNTEVAVPFLLSSKNYGLLWDNYSITKVGDVRDQQILSGLKLFAADGTAGWLTASYISKSDPKKIYIRPESDINYSFLNDQHKFPDSIQLGNSTVKWEGSIASGFTGKHHFHIKYAGYAKIWIDGKQLMDNWRQAWNPATAELEINLEKDKKYKIKIEWDPDGTESYLAVNWLAPIPKAEKNQMAFSSEAGDAINYYFISGANADEVIGGYRILTGKATMLPKWAYGFWQSRERYKTQDEILNTVKEFRNRKIGLDNIVLDWSYWKVDQWGSHEFDPTRFPDPAEMMKTLHDTYKTNLMISVWGKFYENTENFKFLDKNGWMYKRNIANQQRDWIGKGYTSSFYDPLNPKAREAFWNLINKNLYTKGVDAWWMDASEPDIHSNLNIASRKEIMTGMALGSSTKYFNAYPLENAHGIYEGQRKTNPTDRVFILTRSAFAGQQRYAATTWSGDIASRWEDFRAQIPAGINFSMSGIPYWTMDIGGFAVEKRYENNIKGDDLEEFRELNARWYQYGAFVPLFRVHGQFPFREIYNIAPEDHAAYKSMLYYNKLRYKLMPYIYSVAGKTYQNNYTMMRGLAMDFGADTAVLNIKDQYLFGPSLLINPVYQRFATSRNVYLPKGNGWYDFYTGKYFTGGQNIRADAPYERIPLFVKEGSIVLTGPDIQYTSEKPADPITIHVYTGLNASFTLYEDEGTNYNYEKGAFAEIVFNYNEASKVLTIGDRKGTFPGMLLERTFRIIIIGKNENGQGGLDKTPTLEIKYKGTKINVPIKN